MTSGSYKLVALTRSTEANYTHKNAFIESKLTDMLTSSYKALDAKYTLLWK